MPDEDNPRVAAPGTSLLPPLDRIRGLKALAPEICTLDLNTMNSGDQVVMNTPRTTEIMSRAMLAAGWRPEIEIFNPGDLVLARALMARADFPAPALFSFVLGVKYGWRASLEAVQLGRSLLPDGAVWTAFGVGPAEFPMVGLSVLLGGHARVGLEDNIYLDKGVLAKTNASLCKRAVRIISDLGERVATPDVARRILGLDPRETA